MPYPGYRQSEEHRAKIGAGNAVAVAKKQLRSAALDEIFEMLGKTCNLAQRDAIRSRLTDLLNEGHITPRELVAVEDSLRPEPVPTTAPVDERVFSNDTKEETARMNRAWGKAGTNV